MPSVPEPVAVQDHPQLTKSPIVLVAAQIRFDRQHLDPQAVLRFHEAVGKRAYPQIAQAPTPTISLTIGESTGAPASVTSPWQYLSPDGSWTISIAEDSASIQTANGFTTWQDSFRPRLETFLKAISDCMAPTITQRVGLRYINELSDLAITQPSDLSNYLSGSLAPTLDSRIKDRVIAVQQHLILKASDGNACGLRVAFGPQIGHTDRYGCVLDIDAYSDDAVSFDYHQVLQVADTLNEQAHEVFEGALNPTYLGTLR